MIRIGRVLAAGAASLLLGSVALAQDAGSPEGVWTTKKGESRYQFFYCGDGAALCVKLIYLSEKAQQDKPETVPYINTLQVDRAKPDGNARWKGKIVLPGHTFDGSIEMTGADDVLIKGCEFLVLCADIKLKRYVQPS
jgi:hypothetical protein